MVSSIDESAKRKKWCGNVVQLSGRTRWRRAIWSRAHLLRLLDALARILEDDSWRVACKELSGDGPEDRKRQGAPNEHKGES